MYRHGRYSKRTMELRALLRKMAKDCDVKTATVMQAHGLKPLKTLRRRSHVRKALAKAKGVNK
jgi:hypothetical protein